jgi:hypothetical protein
MRWIVLGLLVLLSACSGDPKSWGITGPGGASQPAASNDPVPEATTPPGMSTTGSTYGPTGGASSGTSGYWGYN